MRHVLVHHTPHALLSTLPEGPVESPRERCVTAVVAHLRVQEWAFPEFSLCLMLILSTLAIYSSDYVPSYRSAPPVSRHSRFLLWSDKLSC